MQFDSFLFVLFWIIVLSVYYSIRIWHYQKIVLLIASYLFYAAWNPPFVILLWISTAVDYFVARWICQEKNQSKRRALVCVSLLVNLGLLGYFKYADFLNQSLATVLNVIGIAYHPLPLNIILPVGISFYTFITLSYTLDVYWRKTQAEISLLDFSLYLTFFPHLVAGPIVRAPLFLPQCKTPRRATAEQFFWGLALFLFGIFAKVILSDTALAPVVDEIYAAPATYQSLDVWLAILAFSGQIFFDFAGYSLCAIGVAMTLGFSLPDNFNCPYGALGISDFWRRWHISLSSWLRDYLYISLGGNRGKPLRTMGNLLLVMVLGGLWHGAAWTFVIWGCLHGCLLAGEYCLKKLIGYTPERTTSKIFLMLLTFLIVSLSWIPFRAQGIDNLGVMLSALVASPGEQQLPYITRVVVIGIMTATLGWHILANDRAFEVRFGGFSPLVKGGIIATTLVCLGFFSTGDSRAFIYFQF